MTVPIWRLEKKLKFLSKLEYTGVFEVADHDLAISNFLLKNRRVGLWNYPNVI